MEDMLTPPADRPRPRPLRLVLLMGMTVLLFIVIFGTPHAVPSQPMMSASAAAKG
jgi:hypothetical protein